MCVYHCAQLWYTTQHRTVLIIFTLILQTIIIAQMMSTKGEGVQTSKAHFQCEAHISTATEPLATESKTFYNTFARNFAK